MKWQRIQAVMVKYAYSTRRDFFRIFEIFYWPAFELFIWGLFSIFIAKTSTQGASLVNMLLGGIILWVFFDRASRDISIAFIDELWNRNFINLFSTPLTIGEYIVGVTIMATVKLVVSILFMLFLATTLYAFQLSSIGFYIIPASVGLTIFGWSLSLIVQSFILRFGHTVEVFIWAVAVLMQPLSCVFYPVSTLPHWAAKIAYFLPSTYLFENMRSQMQGNGISLSEIGISYALNTVYLFLAVFYFYRSFAHARKQGSLIKNY